MLGEPAK
jgi:hypothetical protein